MKTIKKVLGAALALSLALAVPHAVPVVAHATEGVAASPGQGGNFGGIHENLSFMGMKAKRVVKSATATLLVTGEGFLDGVCATGGTKGEYSAAFDTTSNTQVDANAGNVNYTGSYTYALSPAVFTYAGPNSDTGQASPKGCWFPPNPVKFTTGLYGSASNNGHVTEYFVHCSDGSNPCTLSP